MIESETIGQVAKRLGIGIETIRFYQRRGLITQPAKPLSGYRRYPQQTVNRIRFIKRAQALGFTLDEIAHLLNLNDNPCNQVQSLAEHKLGLVNQKLADLQRLQQALGDMVARCQNNQDDSHCPLIDSLLP